MKKITYLSWKDIEESCKVLTKKLLYSSCKFDAIISIQRGGCIPGVLLSHLLYISEFYSIGIRTTSSEKINASRLEQTILLKTSDLVNIRDKNVLIIDDVINTGNTLQIALNEVLKFKPSICKTAVLVWDGDNSYIYKVDYYARRTPGWVVFPWEHPEK